MPILLSHSTALERLRSVPPSVRAGLGVSRPFALNRENADYRMAKNVDYGALGIERRPIELLIGPGVKEAQSSSLKTHRFGVAELPPRSVRFYNEGVFASTPQLIFVELARDLDEVDAVVLGFELCGGYSHFAHRISGFYEREPPTDKDAIGRLVEDLAGLRGLTRVRRALDLVQPGSRSPMETLVACALSFPVDMGGLGFAPPQLNHLVELDRVASSIAGTSCCYVDLAWPEAKLGVEYNGGDFHLDPAKDRRRIEALDRMGWSIATFEARDMADFWKFRHAAARLEGRVEHTSSESASSKTSKELYDRLLSATRWGWGLEDALFGVPVARGRIAYHL